MIHKNINIQFPQFESKATMEKTHQDIYSEFLKKEIIVGEEVLEIHSRHSENRTLEQDITIVNNIIKKDGLVIIKTRDDDTGLSFTSYYQDWEGSQRIVGKIYRLVTPSGQNMKKTIFTTLPLKF